jgi:HTH-type transcriptional regulator / antitoxin HigA
MITNERQYKISKYQLRKLEKTIDFFDYKKIIEKVKSEILVKAEFDSLLSERENLVGQILEYETLKSGTVDKFRASTLKELPNILIKARIAKSLSQNKLADLIGVKEQQIQRYEAEKYASASLTRLSQIAKALELNINEIAEFEVRPESIDISDENIAWDQFPVKEMYLRNWFKEFYTGSLPNAIKNSEELVKEYFAKTYSKPLFYAARQRIRSGGKFNNYALIAWQCRVIDQAQNKEIHKKFKKSLLTKGWFRNLVKLSLEDDGIIKAIKYLFESGIRLIIEPHLPQTHLDGAVFMLKNGPVIGLTLRYDRLDNFWFVLIHELVHIKRHLKKDDIESIFDDLEVYGDDLEKETDKEAGEILIPAEMWETALPRYIQSKDTIYDFAHRVGINPAIVAGKIRREMENYTILIDLIGQGKVRINFPDIDFSY